MLGHKERVSLTALNHFGHNYNYVSRSAMYHFMNEHLGLGLPTPIVEEDYPRLSRSQLTVWSNGHARPDGGEAFEKTLLKHWSDDAESKLQKSTEPSCIPLLGWNRHSDHSGAHHESAGRTELELTQKTDHATYWDMQGILHNQTHEETVQVAYLHPKEWNGRTLIWPTTQGLSGLWDAEGKLTEAIKEALENGCPCLGWI